MNRAAPGTWSLPADGTAVSDDTRGPLGQTHVPPSPAREDGPRFADVSQPLIALASSPARIRRWQVPSSPVGPSTADGPRPMGTATGQDHHAAPLGDTGRQAASPHHLAASSWCLLAVLGVQVLLSLRLIWHSTAFQDEALYLRAGHLEWAHWLHGAPIPDFPVYFSGAPFLYPPVGALADSIGGLPGARLLSLCFMLGVTSLLWVTTRLLYGQRAALLAAGLFATLAGTQFLGSFATYDALALFLLTLAAWVAVRSVDCAAPARVLLLIISGITLAAADAVKYATALFTPVVVVIVAFAVWRRHGGSQGAHAALIVLGSWLAVVIAAVVAGGHNYWLGITTSTLARSSASAPVSTVLQRSYVWTSLILVLALLGAILAIPVSAGQNCCPPCCWRPACLCPRSKRGCTPRSACKSTWSSAPGSPR